VASALAGNVPVMYCGSVLQSEEIFLDMFEDEYREMTVSSVLFLCILYYVYCFSYKTAAKTQTVMTVKHVGS